MLIPVQIFSLAIQSVNLLMRYFKKLFFAFCIIIMRQIKQLTSQTCKFKNGLLRIIHWYCCRLCIVVTWTPVWMLLRFLLQHIIRGNRPIKAEMAHQLYVLQVLTFNLLEERMMTKMDPNDQVNKLISILIWCVVPFFLSQNDFYCWCDCC